MWRVIANVGQATRVRNVTNVTLVTMVTPSVNNVSVTLLGVCRLSAMRMDSALARYVHSTLRPSMIMENWR